jgi:hypothetical protein
MKSNKGKGSYSVYKTENRAEKNKIKRLERHCKKHPDDEQGKINLARIKKDGYTPRSKPLAPGSNPTIGRVYLTKPLHRATPGEQLSELLNIPLPKVHKKSKPTVTHRRRKNVKRS